MKQLIELLILIALVVAFFMYRIYAEPIFWGMLVVVVIIAMSELVRHYTFQLLAVVFGVIYLPLNMFLSHVSDLIAPFKKEDRIVYGIFSILFFPLQVIVIVFSIPYEFLLDNAH